MPGRAPGAATRSESEEVAESPARPDQTRRHARLRAAGRRASRSSFATDSLSVAGWTAISRITGFGRAGAIAAVLGPSYLGNIFAATNILPNLAYSLLAGALFSNLLVPPLVRLLDADDPSGGGRLAGAFLGRVILAFGAVAPVLVLAARWCWGCSGSACRTGPPNTRPSVPMTTARRITGYSGWESPPAVGSRGALGVGLSGAAIYFCF